MRLMKLVFCIGLLTLGAESLLAQTAAPSRPAAAAQGPRISGKVVDSTGGVMSSADVKVYQGNNVIREGKTNAEGEFALDVPAGEYRVEVTAPDFAPYSQTMRVAPNMAPLSIALTLATLATNVDVTTQSTEVSVDAEASLTTTNLTGEQLKDLPEDEEQLVTYLQQLAQASGAQGGANMIIDGIGGGRVPSRDQIQQIIINTNSFSATNSGGATIEIITRPGTQRWTGTVNLGFQDSAFDAKGPFETNKPNRQQRAMRAGASGTLIPGRLTANFSLQSTRQEFEGSSIRAVTPSGIVNTGVTSPQTNNGFNGSGQLYINKIHTLNFNGNYNWNKAVNQGIGGFTLPERAANRKGHNYQFQMNDRAIFTPTFIHELRFRVNRSYSETAPVTEAIAINVLDAFNGGGAQNRGNSEGTNLNWGNNVRYQLKPTLNLQAGSDFAYTKNRNLSETNYLGAFTFASLEDYLAGRPLNFRKTTGDPLVTVSQTDMSAFAQLDWRMSTKASMGMGWRYQAQTNLKDYNNIAPTLNFSYQVRQGTVFRAGARKTYSTFAIFNTEQILRNDGTSRLFETVVLNPSLEDPLGTGSGTTNATGSTTIRRKADDLEAPYSYNAQVGIDHNLTKAWRVSFSLDMTKGIHQLRQRNINAPFPGTPLTPELLGRLNSFDAATRSAARDEVDRMRPFYPLIGNIYQYESSANYKAKTLSFRILPPPNLNFWGNRIGLTGTVQYNLNLREDDSVAINHYDWSEWARTGSRHNVNASINLRLPRGFTANIPFNANSGSFYSITTGRDENGDQTTNDRPIGIQRNSEVGPGRYNFNLSVSKTIFLRRAPALPRPANLVPPAGGAAPAPPQAIPAGLPPEIAIQLAAAQAQAAALGQAQVNTGPRMQISVNAQNVLNNTQLNGYSGVLTSPLFGKPTSAGQGRRISINMTFNWQ